MVQVRIENLLSLKSSYISIVFLIAVDFLTKFLANHFLEFGVIVPMMPILDLLLMFNSGIAFSLLDFNNSFTSYGLSIIGVLLVIYLHAMLRNETSKANQFALILILSGALGNILDRVMDGVVTDFLYFHIGDQSFFIFNFADAFITIGAAIFFISELKNYFGSSSA
jgi:signal peptidase II